ncbi:MAG TPA: M23 family metallopeptidase [Acidimicrobiia bacterium]|nr:M23 family metallopeptidase [Acidimicrobiia bacterium]
MSRRLSLFVLVATLAVSFPVAAIAASEPTLLGDGPVGEFVIVFPQDPEATWFLDTFGASRADGHRHIGIDLHAPKGSPVYSLAAGVVTRISTGPRSGAYIVVDHGGGWTSWYMHLDTDEPGTDNGRGGLATAIAAGIAPGVFVDAGQLIGYVGDSGNAEHTIPHTHLELHRNDRAIDPYAMLVEAQERALRGLWAERLSSLLPILL